MSETGLILRTAQQLMNYFGLTDPDHTNFADQQGRLDITGAVYRAVTGKTPNAFLGNADHAVLLVTTNEPVMAALRWISRILPTEAPDSGNGDDVIEHLAGWLADTDPFLGRRPNTADVIGVLERAALAADRASTVPAQRTTDIPQAVHIPSPRRAA
ncbi:hypothetical protein ACF06X_33540 [Streptomyces sp. NPDC015346]|uniref:hypothetical protein n=1 Tax=Streptomyces sp. NPDC015346 TaxID=3364954 RepID=UPI0036F65C64